jgi:tRNA U54 and U55 pseudouridine synthase Pus10
MGKVSEKDFAEMSGRLRARAARLLRQLDAGAGYREQIEREIERRLGKAPVIGGSKEQDPPYAVCVQCSTKNDADARFCKGCGKAMEPRA